MAYFGRTSRCGKLAPKPNPRLKNCSKTSQESSAQSGLSSYQYSRSQRLQSEKSQMRIFPNSGDFILIPTYNGRMKKLIFAPKYRLAIFWRNTCDDHISPHKTTSLTSLSRLSCWCGHLPAVTYMAICILDLCRNSRMRSRRSQELPRATAMPGDLRERSQKRLQ